MTASATPGAGHLVLRAWIIWALGTLFYAYGFFQRVAPSVMVRDLMVEFSATAAVLGNLSAFYFYAYAGLQFPLGILIDRVGPRRIMTAGALCAAAGSVLFATAHGVAAAYLGRFLVGAGVGVALIGTMKLMMIWMPGGRFATIVGVTMFTGTLGALVGQAPLALVIEAMGWRTALLWAGVFALALGVLLWLVVRDSVRGPEEPTGPSDGPGVRAGLAAILGNPQTWLVGAFSFMVSGPVLAFAGLWGVPYAMTLYGLDRQSAAELTSLMLLGFGLGLPMAGWLSDTMGRRKPPLFAGAALCLVTWVAILGLPGLPLWAAYVLFFVNGMASGWVGIVFALARELNAPKYGGSVVGFINMAGIGGVAVLQPAAGWLLDLAWTGGMAEGTRVYAPEAWRSACAIFPACSALALALCFSLRESFNRAATR